MATVKRVVLSFILLCGTMMAQTAITIPAASGGGVKLVLNERPGVNLDQNAYYGNQQYNANLLAAFNTSFEQQIASQFSHASSCPSTSSWTDDTSFGGQPANFWQGATYKVISGADNGQTGTITASTTNTGSTASTYTLSPALTSTCAAGDYLEMTCKTSGGTCGNGLTTSNFGVPLTGTTSFETTDVSPASGSPQGLSVATGGTVTVYFDGTISGQTYINLNGTYTLSYKAKGTTGAPVVGYNVSHNGITYLNSSDTPTVSGTAGAGWTTYTHSFTASEVSAGSPATGQVTLTISGTGTALIQDITLTETGTGGNTTVLRNAVYQRLLSLHPGTIRWMESPIYACTFDNMIASPSARRMCAVGVYTGVQTAPPSMSLNDFLYLNAVLGSDPMWTFSVFSTPTDMANIAAYLNAPCASGNSYATIRCNYLASTPYAGETWTQIFNNIYLEMGNEVWNGSNGNNLTYNATAYGNVLEPAVSGLKGATYYNSKIKIMASGWAGVDSPNPNGSWGDVVLGRAQTLGALPDAITGSGYAFPYITDLSTSLFPAMFAEPVNFSTVQTFNTEPTTGVTYALGSFYQTKYSVPGYIYEENVSAQCGLSGIGITQTTLNNNLASTGAGLALAENILLGARDAGIKMQNVWSLVEDGNSFNEAAANHGSSCTTSTSLSAPIFGINRIMGGPTNSAAIDRPSAIALQVLNTAIGNKLSVLNTTQTSTPTYNQVAAQPDPSASSLTNSIAANSAVPYTQATAFGDGAGNYALIVLCLNPSSTCPVTFSGAGAPTGTVTKTIYTSTNITDNNEAVNIDGTPVVATPTPTTVTSPTSDTLPAFSMTTYTYSTTVLPVWTHTGVCAAAGTAASTVACTGTIPAGNIIRACHSNLSVGGTVTITDSYSDTFVNDLNQVWNSGGDTLTCSYSLNAHGGSTTVTATNTGANYYPDLTVDSYACPGAPCSLDVNDGGGASGSGTAMSSNNITPNFNGDLVVGLLTGAGGSTPAPGTGFTAGINDSRYSTQAYQVQAVSAPIAVTGTLPATGAWLSHAIAFTYTGATTSYTLTVNSVNPTSGVAITVSPTDNNGFSNGTTLFTRSYTSGTTVTLTAPSTASGNAFVSWTGCTSVSSYTCTVNMTAAKNVTVNYAGGAGTLTSVQVTPFGATLSAATGTLQYTVTCFYSSNTQDNCSGKTITWYASQPSLATVNSSGLATYVSNCGTATYGTGTYGPAVFCYNNIVATVNGLSAYATMLMRYPGDTYQILLTPSVFTVPGTATPAPANLVVGSTATFGAGFGGNGSIQSAANANPFPGCNWTSSNPAVGTMVQARYGGQFTAVSAGTAVVSCVTAGDPATSTYYTNALNTGGGVLQTFPPQYTVTVVNPSPVPQMWYVRPDGGTPYTNATDTPSGQCNGKANAAYTSGVNQACAFGDFEDLYFDQVTNKSQWVINGGDTVIVYPKTGGYNTAMKSSSTPSNCPDFTYCDVPSIPSGTATQYTQILGSNYASCTGSYGPNSNATLLLGWGREMVRISQSQFVDFKCFEMTNTSGQNVNMGIVQSAFTSYVNKQNLFIHNMYFAGEFGATTVGNSDDHVHIRAAIQTGYDLDDFPYGISSISVSGGISMTNSLVEFTGCREIYGSTAQYPFIANSCIDENTGGQGDGFGTGAMTGIWYFNNDVWRYNFQDGLDSLHSGAQSETIINNQAYGNLGNQYKFGSVDNATFQNNLSIGNCNRLSLPFNGVTIGASGVNYCRSGGGMVITNWANTGSYILQNNTLVPVGNEAIIYQCDSSWATCPNSATVLQNNIFLGYTGSNAGYASGALADAFYMNTSSTVPTGIWATRSNNDFYNMTAYTPLGTNDLTSNPLLYGEMAAPPLTVLTGSGETVLDNYNDMPTVTSPMRGAGVNVGIATDANGVATTTPPVIGAVNYVGASVSGAIIGAGIIVGSGIKF